MVQGALPQEGAKLLVLRRAQTCRSATGNGGLKATVTLQAGFPGVHGVYRHAEVLSNLPVSMRPTFNPFKRGQAALLKLSAGILGRLPSGHTASLPIHTYTVINRELKGGAPQRSVPPDAAPLSCCAVLPLPRVQRPRHAFERLGQNGPAGGEVDANEALIGRALFAGAKVGPLWTATLASSSRNSWMRPASGCSRRSSQAR